MIEDFEPLRAKLTFRNLARSAAHPRSYTTTRKQIAIRRLITTIARCWRRLCCSSHGRTLPLISPAYLCARLVKHFAWYHAFHRDAPRLLSR